MLNLNTKTTSVTFNPALIKELSIENYNAVDAYVESMIIDTNAKALLDTTIESMTVQGFKDMLLREMDIALNNPTNHNKTRLDAEMKYLVKEAGIDSNESFKKTVRNYIGSQIEIAVDQIMRNNHSHTISKMLLKGIALERAKETASAVIDFMEFNSALVMIQILLDISPEFSSLMEGELGGSTDLTKSKNIGILLTAFNEKL